MYIVFALAAVKLARKAYANALFDDIAECFHATALMRSETPSYARARRLQISCALASQPVRAGT